MLNLTPHWTVAIGKRRAERTLNISVANPRDDRSYAFHITYRNPTGRLDGIRMRIAAGHTASSLPLWQPKDHARDFEVVDGVTYARGQVIGMVVDEDVGVMFKLAWNSKPAADAPHLLSLPYQFDVWDRQRELAQSVLRESLGLGNVCLLIQNGSFVHLDDREAVSAADCVWTPFVDPNLNDFSAMAKRPGNQSAAPPPKKIKEMDPAENKT